MPLSSNALFHFTSSKSNLIDILQSEFRPHYSLEDVRGAAIRPGRVPRSGVAFPLVSFCDIPLSQTAVHMRTYGRYGIGLTKEWAMRAGVTPVLYYHPRSKTSEAIRAAVKAARPALIAKKAKDPDYTPPLTDLICFLKPYSGQLRRQGRRTRRVRFYDEREWRYVPSGAAKVPVLARDEWLNTEIRRQANESARELPRLSFGPDDVRYIIVSGESERGDMIDAIAHIKGHFPSRQIQVLASRILSAEQISADF